MRPFARLRAGLLACVAAGVIGFAGQAPATASVHPEFFGLNGYTNPSQSSGWSRLAGAGIRGWRLPVGWRWVEPIQGFRTWGSYVAGEGGSGYDDLIGEAAAAGIRITPAVATSPTWAIGKDCQRCPPLADSQGHALPAWKAFLADAVRRYGANGTFWQQHTTLRYMPVKAWQIWNEPNFNNNWNGDASARQYGQFLIDSSGAVKGASPSAKVMAAGIPEVLSTRNGAHMVPYIRNMYNRHPGIASSVDLLALHPYSGGREGIRRAILQVRHVMSGHGDASAWLWITEFGWASGGPGSPFTTTPWGQHRRLVRTFRMFVNHRRDYHIARAFWFNRKDSVGVKNWGKRTGLFNEHGSAKPSWWGYVETTRRYLP